jgi:hypothetical protein
MSDDSRRKRRIVASNVIKFRARAAAAKGADRDAVLSAAWRFGADGRLEIGWREEPSASSTASHHKAVS